MDFLLLIVYGKEIHLKTNMYSHLSKVLGNVKKKSLYNQPKPYMFTGTDHLT